MATKHCESALSLLLAKYELKIKDASKRISDIHLDKISHSCCSQWRRLPAYLDMERIVKDDVNRHSTSEEAEKRSLFFSKWVDEKGSDATYEKLITALLEMGCKNDAEKVCKLIQPVSMTLPKLIQSPLPPKLPQLRQPASDHIPPPSKMCHPSNKEQLTMPVSYKPQILLAHTIHKAGLQGCILVTFLISAAVVETILKLSADQVITSCLNGPMGSHLGFGVLHVKF